MATFTAPNGATRNSKTRTYTHAIFLTGADGGPASDGNFYAFAWASSYELALKALATANRRGLTAEIVEVTSSEQAPAPVAAPVEETPAPRLAVIWTSPITGQTGHRFAATRKEVESLKHIYRRTGLQAVEAMI